MENSIKNSFISKNKLKAKAGKSSKVAFKIFRAYIIITLSFVVLYPIFYMVSLSFRPTSEYTNPSIIWVPATWTMEIIKNAWGAIKFPETFKNTAIMTLSNTVLSIIPCCLAGYGLSRFKFKGKKLLQIFLILSIVVPTQTIIVPLHARMREFDFFFLGQIGRIFTGSPFTISLLDSDFAMWILSAFGSGISSGMFIFIFRQFFSSLPSDLEDAAYVDGAGIFKTFTKIIIPCASSPFLVVFILSLIWHWNDTFVPTLMNSSKETLAFAIQNFTNSTAVSANMDVYSLLQMRLAACILFILPILIVYLFLQRFFIQSIDRTGFK